MNVRSSPVNCCEDRLLFAKKNWWLWQKSVRILITLVDQCIYMSVMNNKSYCMSVTFLSRSRWLKLCSYSHTPLICLQTEGLLCWLTKPHKRDVDHVQLCYFALPVSPTTHFSTSFHLPSTSWLASQVNITPPFSHRNITKSGGSTSAHPRAAVQKVVHSHSILLYNLI